MDCRRFQKNLEDYLEGDLDFAGRFGMERHAQQCLNCGREMNSAQKLSQMARELKRVKTPSNFEATVLQQIGEWKSNVRFSTIRRFLTYNIEWPSWRKLALATSSLALIGVVAVYFFHLAIHEQAPSSNWIADGPAPLSNQKQPGLDSDQVISIPPPAAATLPGTMPSTQPSSRLQVEYFADEYWTAEPADSEFVEYQLPGPGNRPVVVRLPKRIRMQYRQPSEEYFIRNVSH